MKYSLVQSDCVPVIQVEDDQGVVLYTVSYYLGKPACEFPVSSAFEHGQKISRGEFDELVKKSLIEFELSRIDNRIKQGKKLEKWDIDRKKEIEKILGVKSGKSIDIVKNNIQAGGKKVNYWHEIDTYWVVKNIPIPLEGQVVHSNYYIAHDTQIAIVHLEPNGNGWVNCDVFSESRHWIPSWFDCYVHGIQISKKEYSDLREVLEYAKRLDEKSDNSDNKEEEEILLKMIQVHNNKVCYGKYKKYKKPKFKYSWGEPKRKRWFEKVIYTNPIILILSIFLIYLLRDFAHIGFALAITWLYWIVIYYYYKLSDKAWYIYMLYPLVISIVLYLLQFVHSLAPLSLALLIHCYLVARLYILHLDINKTSRT